MDESLINIVLKVKNFISQSFRSHGWPVFNWFFNINWFYDFSSPIKNTGTSIAQGYIAVKKIVCGLILDILLINDD